MFYIPTWYQSRPWFDSGQVHEVDGLKSGNEAINNALSQGRMCLNGNAHALLFNQAWAYPNRHVSCQQGRQKRLRSGVCTCSCDDVGQECACAPIPTLKNRGTHALLFLIVGIGACVRSYPTSSQN